MEDVNCLLCGSADRRVYLRGQDLMCGVPGEFTLMSCKRCGFVYLSPRPDEFEIDQYYPDTYAFYSSAGAYELSAWQRATHHDDLRRRCQLIVEHHRAGNLLDIGAASGNFVSAMRDRGWNVRGLEPSETAVERARNSHGVTMDHGTLESVDYAPGSFDVVTMWEVLEHVRQPRETLTKIHTLLRPGGHLVLSLPNRDAFDAKIFRRGWVGYDVPRHFSVFSRRQISQAVVDAGFEHPKVFAPAGILGAVHMGLICVLSSFMMSLRAISGSSPRKAKLIELAGKVISHPVAIVLLFLALLPYSWTARALNRGTTMVVVAKKAQDVD